MLLFTFFLKTVANFSFVSLLCVCFHQNLIQHFNYILIMNQLDALISQIYFWNKNLHVSDSSSVHHQEFFTVHAAVVYVTQVCWELGSRIRMEFCPDPALKLSSNLYDIYHCCVYSEKLLMMDKGTVQNMWSFTPKTNLRN